MDLRIQVPGLSYFSIEIVLGLRQHTLWSFWVDLREEGYAPLVSPVAMPGVPKSDRRPVWRRRPFFISSVDDSVLERSAALLLFWLSSLPALSLWGRGPLRVNS